MLTLLSSILSWSDLEREQAGLQRASSGSAMNRRPSGAIQKVAKVEEEPASEVSLLFTRTYVFYEDALLTTFSPLPVCSPSLNSSSSSSSRKLPADPLPPPLLPPTPDLHLPPLQPPTPLSSPHQQHAPTLETCLLQQLRIEIGPSPLDQPRLEEEEDQESLPL